MSNSVASAHAAPVVASRLLVALLSCSPWWCSAQTIPLSTVVVTGSREPLPLDRLVADVTVIDREAIRASSADSIEDLLRRAGGIQLSRNGGPGQSASVLLRGSSASSVVVLVDGVRIGSATLAQTDLASLSLAQVERIEILRGPGSSLYGADAVGGVVQIITQRGAGATHLSGRVAIGGLGSSAAELSLAGASGGIDYSVSASRESSDGVSAILPNDAFGLFNPDRDGYARRSAHLGAGLTLASGQRIGVSVLENRLRSKYDSAQYLPPAFLPDANADFRARTDTRVASLDYRGAITPTWTTSVQVSEQRDDLHAGADDPSDYRTLRHQATWQNAWSFAPQKQLVLALEQLDESVQAATLGAPPDRHNSALVLGYTARYGDQKLQADLRHDHNSVYGDVGTGKLGWAMDLPHGLTLRAVAGTAFRGPSFNELYYPRYGVATLRPERSRSVEVGADWRSGDASAGITLYRNRVRDLIGYEPDRGQCPADPSYDFGCARNVDRALLKGVTLSAGHRVGELRLKATLDFLDAKDVANGQRLTRRAAHQESASVDWTRGAWLFGAAIVGVGARPEGGTVLGGYQTLDLQARWTVAPRVQLETRLLNATDRRYQPVRDYQAIGRQAWLGVRFESAGI